MCWWFWFNYLLLISLFICSCSSIKRAQGYILFTKYILTQWYSLYNIIYITPCTDYTVAVLITSWKHWCTYMYFTEIIQHLGNVPGTMETVLRARNTRKVRNIWGLKTPPSSSPFVLGGDVKSMTMVIYLGWKMIKQTDITLAKLTSSDWRSISIILYHLSSTVYQNC